MAASAHTISDTTAMNYISMSLVRFDRNDYSVPVKHAHQTVVAKGGIDRVEVFRDRELIACHRRLWTEGDASYQPRHYLELLERKPDATRRTKVRR